MDEHSAIPEKDAASTLPEEPVELITPVDEPQPGSTAQVEPSPEDPPPAEPPKKESIWKKHKTTILGVGAAILALTAGVVLFWDNLKKSASVDTDSTSEPHENTPTGTPEISESVIANNTSFSPSQSDFIEDPSIEYKDPLQYPRRGHLRNLPLGQHASPEKQQQAKENGFDMEDGQTYVNPTMCTRNYNNERSTT